MDSVLSSGQNEQSVSSIGRKAPETVIDNDDELEDSQHLLFGGTSAPTSGTTGDTGIISAAAKVGGTVQRARDNSGDLNLVGISGITNAPEKTAKTNGTAYDSNPLPALARTGTATTVALQSPSPENAIPAGRRSGASDRIAIQLTEDSTPMPLIPTGLRLSEMDPATRHNVVKASANLLFSQLTTEVTGSSDTRPAPVVSAALNRRKSGEPAVGDDSTANTTLAPSLPPAYRPATDTRIVADNKTVVDTRLPADIRPNSVITPVVRAAGDKVIVGGMAGSPEPVGTTYGARPRPVAEPLASPDSSNHGSRTRAVAEGVVPAEVPPGQRLNTKSVGDGLVTGAFNASLNGSPRNQPEPLDVSPIPVRVPTKNVSDGAGTLIAGGLQTGGDLVSLLPPMRKSPTGGDQAFISQVPNPPNTKGYPVNADRPIPVARSFDPYAGTPTPQVVPDLIPAKSPRGHNELPADVNGPIGARSGDMARGLPVVSGVPGDKSLPVVKPAGTTGDTPLPVPSPAGKDIRQTLVNMLNTTNDQVANTAARVASTLENPLPGAPSRKDLQIPAPIPANVPVIKDGQVYVPAPAARPGVDNLAPSTPLPAVVRPDGTIARTADGPKGSMPDGGIQLGTGMKQVISGAGDLINTAANNSLPRSERPRADQPVVSGPGGVIREATIPGANAAPVNGRNGETQPVARINDGTLPIPAEKGARPLEQGVVSERGAIKGVDTAAVAGTNSAGSLIKNGDPIIAGDKTAVKPADGRIAADPAATRTGESVARAGETTVRGSENVRTADGVVKVGGEPAVGKNDAVVKAGELTVKSAEGIVKSSENGTKVADNSAKTAEGGKVADVVAKSVNQQVKASAEVAVSGKQIEVSGKQVEVASKAGSEVVSAQRVQDNAIKVGSDAVIKTVDAGIRINSENAVVRSQDAIQNSQMVVPDKGGRLSDAIVRAADQPVKGPEVNQPVKLDAAVQSNQVLANNQQPVKIDAVRIDANAATKAGDQNPIIAQNQLGNQNQIAQNQNAQMAGRANDQIVHQGVKAADVPVPGQRNPIADVKVDQVVADILNHVRHNGKDQQAGAKILSSLDQSNIAANQQLDPKGLLDAAAVRRILDGQGIVINPATLNTIMEGIRPTGEHAVDYALPSIGSLNLSQIISLGERLQEAVAGAGSETSEPQPKPQLQQHRTKYLVKDGDTLESIAQEKLGDARLVQLLITINRALVNYRLEGERKVAYVVPNQYLWLPTDHELDVHKKNFFGKHGKDGSVSLGISSKQNTPLIPPVSFDRTIEVSAEVSASMQDFRPGTGSSQPLSGNRMSAGYEVKKYVPSLGSASGSRSGSISSSGSGSGSGSTNDSTGDSKDNKMAGNLDKVRHAGGRKSVNLDEIEYVSTQVSHRQCYQVREGETLMSIAASLESMGHISMWKLLARINGFQIEEGGIGKSIENLFAGQFIVLPTTEELNEFKLLDKLSSCTNSPSIGSGTAKNAFFCVQEQKKIEIPPPPALVALAQGVGGLSTVHKLSSYTRLVLNDLPQLENCFSITVETRWNGQWKPMASYECRHGQTTRHLYNKQGEIKSMELDLPPYVVKEMAREDFIRNWNAYVNSFMGEAVERFVQS